MLRLDLSHSRRGYSEVRSVKENRSQSNRGVILGKRTSREDKPKN